MFPDLGNDTVLKPLSTGCCNPTSRANSTPKSATLLAALLECELQSGFAGKGRPLDLVGWITMNNHSGKTFENAKIKFMAGDVNKIQPPDRAGMVRRKQ